MIRLQKLYTEPQLFEPIVFDWGINLIIGEKAEENPKTNSVGKTMCIEFINFCLLKKKDESRVMLIPESILPPTTLIILDLEIAGFSISIIRTTQAPDNVRIIHDTQEIFFNTIDQATDYLSDLLFRSQSNESLRPSFRQLLSPLMRDERSEFKDLINGIDTQKRATSDFTSHLYLLGFDFDTYKKLKKINQEIEKQIAYIRELKKEVTENDSIPLDSIKKKINGLDDEVQKIEKSIETFKSSVAFESIQKDLIAIESQIDALRTENKAIAYEIKKLQTLPEAEYISKTDIAIVYNQFKSGLGDLIEKSIEEVESFKAKIDSFKKTLVNGKLETLKASLHQNTEKNEQLDKLYLEKLSIIDKGVVLKDLKTGIQLYHQKSEELNKIRYLYSTYNEAKTKKEPELNRKKEALLSKQKNEIEKRKTELLSFEKTILEIHNQIMGNKEASFEIKVHDKLKEPISFEMRIDGDGGHSTERTKVFIYDMALLFDQYTQNKHPRLLIHDNIFDVDQDTLVQCLNYVYNQERRQENNINFQYILTLNRDKIETEERKKAITMDITCHRKALFTKPKKFLGVQYVQKNKYVRKK